MLGMVVKRVAAASALGVAAVVLAGCGGAANEAPPPSPPPNVLAGLDPCALLSGQELASFGFAEPGEFIDQGVGEQGCEFDSEAFMLSLYKSEEGNRAYWDERRDNFSVFEPNQVGDRQGLKLVTHGAVGLGICHQTVFAGPGSVSVQVTSGGESPEGVDACAKAMEIAEVVESRLPA